MTATLYNLALTLLDLLEPGSVDAIHWCHFPDLSLFI